MDSSVSKLAMCWALGRIEQQLVKIHAVEARRAFARLAQRAAPGLLVSRVLVLQHARRRALERWKVGTMSAVDVASELELTLRCASPPPASRGVS